MQLNLNCVRDTLIVLEEWLVLNDELSFKWLSLEDICKSSNLLKYSKSEIAYTLIMLTEADFIKSCISYGSNEIDDLEVLRFTYQGHQLLESIRPQSMWDKIYSIADKTGSKSISTIMEIADIVLPDVIKSVLHS